MVKNKELVDVLLLNYTLVYRGLLPPMGSVGHLDPSKDTLPERQERRGALRLETKKLFEQSLLEFETKDALIDAFDECTSDETGSGKKYLGAEDREDILSRYDALKQEIYRSDILNMYDTHKTGETLKDRRG